MPSLNIAQAIANAREHHKAGRFAQAEEVYKQVLQAQPNNAEAMHLLGVAAHQQDRNEEAASLIGRSLKLRPNVPGAWYHYGEALGQLRRYPEAIAAYRTGFSQERPSGKDLSNFGLILIEAGRMDEGIAQFRAAILADPTHAPGHNNLATALQRLGDHEGALEVYRQAVAVHPGLAATQNNLGVALARLDQLEEAEAAHRRAIEFDPGFANAYCNLGFVLRRQGRYRESFEMTEKSLQIDPNFTIACWNLGCLELTFGDWNRGLQMYEARLRLPDAPAQAPGVRWDGTDPSGKRILIQQEQGYGDVLMTARFLPLLAQRAGRVIVEVEAVLADLMRSVRGVSEIAVMGQPRPEFDASASIMSLPYLLQTAKDALPREVPYLMPDAQRIEQWGRRLNEALSRNGSDPRALKVGLAWRGKQKPDPLRTTGLTAMAPLTSVDGVTFISMQVGEGSTEAANPPAGMRLIDLTDGVRDFADSAALLTHLDLLITIDSAIAHLAGAIGRPVWTLVPFVPDWRWGLESEASTWYPTMRLFRQPKHGDWTTPISVLQKELAVLAGQGGIR